LPEWESSEEEEEERSDSLKKSSWRSRGVGVRRDILTSRCVTRESEGKEGKRGRERGGLKRRFELVRGFFEEVRETSVDDGDVLLTHSP